MIAKTLLKTSMKCDVQHSNTASNNQYSTRLCIRTSLGYMCFSCRVCNCLFIYTDITALRLLLSFLTFLYLKCCLDSFSCATLLATIPVLVHEHIYHNFMHIYSSLMYDQRHLNCRDCIDVPICST